MNYQKVVIKRNFYDLLGQNQLLILFYPKLDNFGQFTGNKWNSLFHLTTGKQEVINLKFEKMKKTSRKY